MCVDVYIRKTVTLIHSPSVIIVNYDQVLSPAKHCDITVLLTFGNDSRKIPNIHVTR